MIAEERGDWKGFVWHFFQYCPTPLLFFGGRGVGIGAID
jgi:hypothetical protein